MSRFMAPPADLFPGAVKEMLWLISRSDAESGKEPGGGGVKYHATAPAVALEVSPEAPAHSTPVIQLCTTSLVPPPLHKGD